MSLFLAGGLLGDDSSNSQNTRLIEVDAHPTLSFDGESSESIEVNASLIDGFVYRIPLEFHVNEGIKLSDLYGQTICQCASLQMEKGNIGENGNKVVGSILLRPNKTHIEQTLRLYGTLPGEVQATEVGRIKVGCKVFAPLRLQPAQIEVTESQPFPKSIKLELSQGVSIQKAEMDDGHSVIKGKYEKEASQFWLEFPDDKSSTDMSWQNRDGNLSFHFQVQYMGQQASYGVVVPYGPPRPTRVAPEDVVFRAKEGGTEYMGRLFVLGLRSNERPDLVVEYRVDDTNWVRADVDFVVGDFSRGRASGHIGFPMETTVLSKGTQTRLRLVDKASGKTIAEFNGSLSDAP